MTEIPQIVEDLSYGTVIIPEQEEWPDYLGGSPLAARSLYSFYYGLRAGFQRSNALGEEPFSPSAE